MEKQLRLDSRVQLDLDYFFLSSAAFMYFPLAVAIQHYHLVVRHAKCRLHQPTWVFVQTGGNYLPTLYSHTPKKQEINITLISDH